MFGKKNKSENNPSDEDKPDLIERLKGLSTPAYLAIVLIGICCLIGAYLLLG